MRESNARLGQVESAGLAVFSVLDEAGDIYSGHAWTSRKWTEETIDSSASDNVDRNGRSARASSALCASIWVSLPKYAWQRKARH